MLVSVATESPPFEKIAGYSDDQLFALYLTFLISCDARKPTIGFPNMSDTNLAVQAKKMAGILDLERISIVLSV